MQPEYRSFSVDPQLTTFETLQKLLANAFYLNSDFTISYLSRDVSGEEVYLSLLSDWDLDAAFLSASHPCLQIKVDAKPFEGPDCECSTSREDVAEPRPVPYDALPMLSFKGVSHTASVESGSWAFVDITQLPIKTDNSELNSKFLGLEDWDIISAKEVTGNLNGNFSRDRSMVAMPFVGAFVNQVEKTINKVQRIFISSEIEDEIAKAARPPLSDADFHKFLDQQGRLVRPGEFRLHVYHGGIEPSLRKVAWRHLLNIFPDGMTGEERFYYLKRKANEYADLKKKWLSDEREEVKYITNMVHKDVLRTDRMHKFYAGGDENHNVTKLYNLLCTYALSHPDVSYCQGMSDLASPILYVMKDEAHAYLCFCGVMSRLKGNFMLDGVCMTQKFDHLSMLLRCCDPEFYDYLGEQNANDLFFCYRWLLLELKREFAFHDALSVLEVMWSSLPPDYPEGELELCGPPAPLSPCISPTDRMRFKFAKQRSVSQSGSIPSSPKSSDITFDTFDQKSDTSKTQNGNRQKKRLHSKDGSSIESDISEESGYSSKSASVDQTPLSVINNDLPIAPNHFSEPEPTRERKTSDGQHSVKSPGVATTNGSISKNPYSSLPPPQDFGGGNPFMLFMCLTLLIEHRDFVIGNHLDYNELAMHFDRMVRRHNAEKVLYRARTLFADYLRAEINMTQAECSSPVNSPVKRSVTGHKGESC